MAGQLTIVDHPLVQHKLTHLRRKETPTPEFRSLVREMSLLLAYEVLRDLPLTEIEIETPLAAMRAPIIEGKKLCLVSILRAGNGILEGMLDLIPDAPVGHIGIYRDPKTLEAVEYYFKVPDALGERRVVVCDPMLATGHTASAALTRLKENGARNIHFLCLLSAPEGVAVLEKDHPDVPIFTAALDERLNEKGYIEPGLGDAGDRIYGTR